MYKNIIKKIFLILVMFSIFNTNSFANNSLELKKEVTKILVNNENKEWNISILGQKILFKDDNKSLFIKKEKKVIFNIFDIYWMYLGKDFFYKWIKLPDNYYQKWNLLKDKDFINILFKNSTISKIDMWNNRNKYNFYFSSKIIDILWDTKYKNKLLYKNNNKKSYLFSELLNKKIDFISIDYDNNEKKIEKINIQIEWKNIFIKYFDNNLEDNNYEYLWWNYYKNNDLIYFSSDLNKIEWVDLQTFEYIHYDYKNQDDYLHNNTINYAKDKNNIYLRWKRIYWFDINSFQIINDRYSKDKNYVYIWWDEKIPWAEVKSFEVIKYNYTKDKNSVYYMKKKIEWADLNSFKFENWIYKDKNFIYKNWKQVKWANNSSFEKIDNFYSKDNQYVYFEWKKIEWVDLNSFKIMTFPYLKDKNNYYYYWKKVEWNDFKTFTIIDYDYSKDKNNFYYRWQKINWVDLKNLKIIDSAYIKDNTNLFFLWKKINWVDLNTFEVLEWPYFRDKNNIYYLWKKQNFSNLNDKYKYIALQKYINKIDKLVVKLKNNNSYINKILYKLDRIKTKNDKVLFLINYLKVELNKVKK